MSDHDTLDAASRESRADDKTQSDLVARMLAEIELATGSEKEWHKDAEKARNIYRAEAEGKDQRFNILFSNVQTEVPSLYNSTPTPDVRTRYNDRDEVSRLTCQTVERILSYSVDTYDFDGTMKAAVQDRQLAGRGTARVRYKPYEYKGAIYQEVTCEHVPWKQLRLGPATSWEDMPWVAFEHYLTRDQLMTLAPDIGAGVNLDMTLKGDDSKQQMAPPNVYKRAVIWEIWDRKTRKVFWIAKSVKARPIRVDDDPLDLIGFFPCPEPMYAVRTSGSMIPVCPYRIIAPLVEELEEITVRIQALIKVIRWRGFRHPALPGFESLSDAEDGELLPADEGVLSLIQGGGIDKYVWLMPIEQAINTVQQLYVQREQIKQTIFEVSGLSDILRGQTNPNETLGAQEIKANYGSMRMQDGQKDVQRFCRDLFRIKAEIACNLFSSQNLMMQSGMKQPSRQTVMAARAQLQQMQMVPQNMGHNGGPPMTPPADLLDTAKAVAWEDILEVIKSGMMRSYRIDIESDSTIRGEIRSQQEAASNFIGGLAQFLQAIEPAIQSGVMKKDVAVDLLASFCRMFKLGKQADDALQRMGQQAMEEAQNPPPAQPSPEEIKAKAQAEQHQARMQQDTQKHALSMQQMQTKAQTDQQIAGTKLQVQQATAQMDLDARAREMEMELTKAQWDMAMKEQEMAMKHQDHQLQGAVAHMRAQGDMSREQTRIAGDQRKAKLAEFMADQQERRAANPPPQRRN